MYCVTIPKLVYILSNLWYIVFRNGKFFRFFLFGCYIPSNDTFHNVPIPLCGHFTFGWVIFYLNSMAFRFGPPTASTYFIPQKFWGRYDVERRWNGGSSFKVGNPQLGSSEFPFGIWLFRNYLKGGGGK